VKPEIFAATSVGAVGVSWVATANEYLTLVATVIAIIAGVITVASHVHKWWKARKP
jgi:hypothetical protein